MSAPEAEATGTGLGGGVHYAYLRPAGTPVARTVEVNPSLLVDVDADGRPLGVEVLDGSPWWSALMALAMQGRVRIT